MNNVLVTNLSILGKKNPQSYIPSLKQEVEKQEIEASYTNESILECVEGLNSIRQFGISKVIALISNAVENNPNSEYGCTAKEYYKQLLLSKGYPEPIWIRIDDEAGVYKKTPVILDKICSEILPEDCVYIDSAGGSRRISNLIPVLVNLLKYKGIKNAVTLYADTNVYPKIITDTEEFSDISILADGFNEFMTTGKSTQLSKYFDNRTSIPEVKNLISSMKSFSDIIILGRIDKLDEAKKKLETDMNALELITEYDDLGVVIIKQFLPLIKRKLVGESTNEIGYRQLIQWCLENDLIQLAVTIYTEKIPVYLFQRKVIKYVGNYATAVSEYKNKRTVAQPEDWECEVFYKDILDIKNPKLVELQKYIVDRTKPTSKEVLLVTDKLSKIEDSYPSISGLSGEWNSLRTYFSSTQFTSGRAAINSLGCQHKIVHDLLGIPYDEVAGSNKSLKTKFTGIEKLKSFTNEDIYPFKFSASFDSMIHVYYAYIYVKTLRNRMNHVTSEESLTDNQKEILKQNGFNPEVESFEETKVNLFKALEAILDVEKQVNPNDFIDETKTTEPESYSTDLVSGDIVDANCVGKKIIRIEGYEYDIQMVLPEGEEPVDYIGKKVKVVIKQISKVGRICQVGLQK